MLYAITDIETTGSYAGANGITEICILISDGERVIEKFETLINPLQPIPRYIQAMTGISNAMVASAPPFEEVAEKIYTLLHDKVFVAHNVNFDYSFIKSQLSYCGYDLVTHKLCTVRLSRKLIPGFPSYSLGNLCHSLDIIHENHHRAGGDTAVTAIIFHRLMKIDAEGFIKKSIGRYSKEQVLPPNVAKTDFDQLPYTPGVYFFKNEKGKVIYVGKAKNIRYRVNSHFSNNSVSRQKQNFLNHTYSIHYEPCATELMAHILESVEIKKRWPVFNAAQKRREDNFGIFRFEDQNGYHRLAIEKNKPQLSPVHIFSDLLSAQAALRKLIKDHFLCPKLCFLQHANVPCEEAACNGACSGKESKKSYNARVEEAICSLQEHDSFVIVENGLQPGEVSCILVEKGRFYGMGYLPETHPIENTTAVKDFIQPLKENMFIRNIVLSYANKFPEKVKTFSSGYA